MQQAVSLAFASMLIASSSGVCASEPMHSPSDLPPILLAQAGSTGGTLGKQDKSLSGERQEQEPAPPRDARPVKPAPVKPAAATSQYLGCFRDQGNPFGTTGRDLNGFYVNSDNMTSARCIAICRGQGFAYAATQHTIQCFCGTSYGRSGAAGNCDMPCGGNPSEMCGGYWANSVYSVSGAKTH